MRRLRTVLVLTAALAALAYASVATAATFSKVTGGQIKITLSSVAAKALTDHHIAVTTLAPATQSGASVTLPVSGGRLNLANLNGVIATKGRLRLAGNGRTVTLSRLTLATRRGGATLWGAVREAPVRACPVARPHHRRVCRRVFVWRVARLANITGTTRTGNTATGTARLTVFSANLFNRLAGAKIAAAGQVLGTGQVTVTVK